MVAPVVVGSFPTHHSFKDSAFFSSEFLPISEEKEEDDSQDSTLASKSDENKTNLDWSPTLLQKFVSAAMFNPQNTRLYKERRPSAVSTSSSQSNYQCGASLRTPTMTNVSSIANDRESMQTPRPNNNNTKADPFQSDWSSRPAGLVNHGKDLSETTLGLNEGQNYDNDAEAGRISNDYATNSLGGISNSSSGHGNCPLASEFGDKATTTTTRTRASSSARKSKKKAIAPPELLVIVRPPPSKQVNPLNLQIQLVIPQVHSNTIPSRASMDSSRDENSITPSGSSTSNGGNSTLTAPTTPNGSESLKRSSSMTSSRSTRSEASSGGYSNASSSNSGRRVTPLYNLNFHNITATTVTDAGTDEKVAKFGKKAVEIDGFGQLEPHEYFTGVNDLATLMQRRQSSRTALSNTSNSDFNSLDALSEASHHQGTFITKTTSRLSDVGVAPHDQVPPTSFDAMSPEAKNPEETGLGGKFLSRFKKFSIGTGQNLGGKINSIGTQSIRSGNTTHDTPTSLLAKVTSSVNKVKEGGETIDENTDVMNRTESMVGGQITLGQALGIDVPQLIAGGGLRSDGRKTEGYFWTVKKWNRRSALDYQEDGRDLRLEEAGSNPILNSVWKRFNIVNRMGGQEIHPPCSEVPVRFEWTRNKERKKSSVVSSGHSKPGAADGAIRIQGARRSFFDRGSLDVKNNTEGGNNVESIDVIRNNLKPPKPGQTSRPSSIYSNSSNRPRGSMDAGSQGGSYENGEDSDPEDSETIWSCHLVLGPTTRIPIGSLSPTPHHPKLIGQLSIPFPLPDLSHSGLGADGAGLTREELKDIISITCLFVVIREGFGGLVKRKK